MFVDYKSEAYRFGGKPSVLVLRQLDNQEHSAEEFAKTDNINLPFVNDENVSGKWKAFDFCRTIESFAPEKRREKALFFSEVKFKNNGAITSLYDYGARTLEGDDVQVWTKGFVLQKWNSTACAYEIRTIGGTEYLFIEWKSGDYTWGGWSRNTMYL